MGPLGDRYCSAHMWTLLAVYLQPISILSSRDDQRTPMTLLERNAIIRAGPWILYDGACGLCTRGAACLGPIARRHGFRLVPLQSPIGRAFDTGIDEMQVITRRGNVVG